MTSTAGSKGQQGPCGSLRYDCLGSLRSACAWYASLLAPTGQMLDLHLCLWEQPQACPPVPGIECAFCQGQDACWQLKRAVIGHAAALLPKLDQSWNVMLTCWAGALARFASCWGTCCPMHCLRGPSCRRALASASTVKVCTDSNAGCSSAAVICGGVQPKLAPRLQHRLVEAAMSVSVSSSLEPPAQQQSRRQLLALL